MAALALYPPQSQDIPQDELTIPALWSLALRKKSGQLPAWHPDRDFTEKTWQDILHNCQHASSPVSTALALSLPLENVLTRQTTRSQQTSARHYLDHLLLEIRLLHDILCQQVQVQSFWLLGDALHWLQPAELTELIFKLQRLFPRDRPESTAAILELAYWPEQEGIWALAAGLGFSHILARDSLLRSHQAQLQDTAQAFGLGLLRYQSSPERQAELIILEPSQRAPDISDCLPQANILLGAGLEGQSIVGPHYINNHLQLDAYYQSTTSGHLPIASGGVWRNN